MNKSREILDNEEVFINFYKERYPLIYKSNIFFRDLQYSIIDFLKKRDIKVKYLEAEKITYEVTDKWERDGFLTRIDNQSWKVNKLPENDKELTTDGATVQEERNKND